MSKHTPGPWGQRGVFIDGARGVVAEVSCSWFNHKEREANAALIAAAPELYAACLRAIASDQTSDMVRVSILAAIAKAEGRD